MSAPVGLHEIEARGDGRGEMAKRRGKKLGGDRGVVPTQVVADWQALRTRKRVVAKMLAHFQKHLFHVKKPKLASLVAA
jgi:hypothetical protein